jgi:uncharacterized membrane protein YphA (DoxX/SURF4 family)
LLLARLGLGATFVVSGVSKFQYFSAFQRAVYDYGLVPVPVATFISHCLPGLEVLLGAYVIIGLFLRPAALGLGLMLAGFIGILSYALVTGMDIDCGCYVGGKSEPVTWKKVAEDVGLLLLALWVWRSQAHRWVLDSLVFPKQFSKQ